MEHDDLIALLRSAADAVEDPDAIALEEKESLIEELRNAAGSLEDNQAED